MLMAWLFYLEQDLQFGLQLDVLYVFSIDSFSNVIVFFCLAVLYMTSQVSLELLLSFSLFW